MSFWNEPTIGPPPALLPSRTYAVRSPQGVPARPRRSPPRRSCRPPHTQRRTTPGSNPTPRYRGLASSHRPPPAGARRASTARSRALSASRGGIPAEIVLGMEVRGRRSAGRPERDGVEELGQLVEVEEGHEQAVAEPVRAPTQPPVSHPALVDRGCGHAASASSRTAAVAGASSRSGRVASTGPRPPSACETRSADQTPSSWKPHLQYEPQ